MSKKDFKRKILSSFIYFVASFFMAAFAEYNIIFLLQNYFLVFSFFNDLLELFASYILFSQAYDHTIMLINHISAKLEEENIN